MQFRILNAPRGRRWAALLPLLLVFPPKAGITADCSVPGHEDPPRTEVEVVQAPVVYRHDRSSGLLSSKNPALRQGQRETGLTSAETGQPNIRLEVISLPLGDGRNCVAVKTVVVSLKLATTVDVASDYPEGSCQYRVILDHENEHVAIFRRAFERTADEFRWRLNQAVRPFSEPFAMTSGGNDADAVAEKLRAVLNPAWDDYLRETERANAAIDTPENYARVQSRCSSW